MLLHFQKVRVRGMSKTLPSTHLPPAYRVRGCGAASDRRQHRAQGREGLVMAAHTQVFCEWLGSGASPNCMSLDCVRKLDIICSTWGEQMQL